MHFAWTFEESVTSKGAVGRMMRSKKTAYTWKQKLLDMPQGLHFKISNFKCQIFKISWERELRDDSLELRAESWELRA